MGKFKDLTGQKFGRLTVIEKMPEKKNRKIIWKCLCDCGSGKEVYTTSGNLSSGNTQSCGCLQKEKAASNCKKDFNRYIIHKDYYEIFDERGNSFYIDLEDFEKVSEYRWYLTKHGYWGAHIPGTRKRLMLHRFLCPTDSYLVDHANHNKNDNRKNNLRPATALENNRNHKINSLNKSGFIGVSYNGSSWIVNINMNNKTKYLGSFKNKEEAIKARLEAEAKYFGEFAPQKHLFEQYGIKIDMVNEDGSAIIRSVRYGYGEDDE